MNYSSFNYVSLNRIKHINNCTSLKTIYATGDWASDKITNSIEMFYNCVNLVGKVPYDSTKVDASMANLDGYFTKKSTL